MFRCLPLFTSTPCPALLRGDPCNIPRCLFSHENLPPPVEPSNPTPELSPKPSGQSVDPRLRRIVEARSSMEPQRSGGESEKCKRLKVAEDGSRIDGQGTYQDGSSAVDTKAISEDEDDGGGVMLAVDRAPPPIKASKPGILSARSSPEAPKKPAPSRPIKSAMKQAPTEPPKISVQPKPTPPKASIPAPVKAVSLPKPQEVKPSLKASSAPLTLNPRLIPRTPAPHNVRYQLLQKLYTELTRLSGDPSDHDKKQTILKKALDIEEETATEKRSIYTNVMKKTVVKYMKQKPEDYKKEVEEEEAKAKQALAKAASEAETANGQGAGTANGKRKRQQAPEIDNTKPALDTGLDALGETERLRKLVHKPEILKKYDFLVTPPTLAEVRSARDGVESSAGWEVCDRCKCRFQVFPGRRELDGALTSGGECTHHPGRSLRFNRTAGAEQKWSCCNTVVGFDQGCAKQKHHVFKVSDPKRLAVTEQYIVTPPNKWVSEEEEKKRAIAVDCEMGYTTHGMELIRVTATIFPTGETLLDALVRPLGDILDLNTIYSGVFPEMMASAKPPLKLNPPYPSIGETMVNPTSPAPEVVPKIPILPSPQAARQVLLGYITPNTPIIGHSLDNDLHALRLCHPSIVDTSILFPHTRGFPLRNRLKYLVSDLLGREIQVEGDENGHDSAVDARCAAELVRYKIRALYKKELRALSKDTGVSLKA